MIIFQIFKFSFLKQKDKHQGKSCSAILFQFLFLFLFMSGFIPSTLADGCKHIFSERQIPKQKGRVYPKLGIEFEGLMPARIEWKQTIHSSIEHLNNFYSSKKHKGTKPKFIRTEEKIIPESLLFQFDKIFRRPKVSILYKKKEQYYRWEIKDDITIQTVPGLNRIEVASPILRSKQDRQSFYSLLHHLKQEQKLMSEPETGGIHIHVDYGKSFSKKDLYYLIKLFVIMEHSFYDYFEISQERKEIFQRDTPNLINFLEEASKEDYLEKEIYIAQMIKGLIRWRRDYNTVEFRLFNSTLDSELIEFYVHFSTKIIRAIKNKNPKLLAFIEQNSSNGDIQELFNILELKTVSEAL